MSINFQLFRKGSDTPEKLSIVDNEMAEFFGEKPDPVRWFQNWYNTIGPCLAFGDSFDEIVERCPENAPIIEWLKDNFEVNSWRD